MSNFNGHYNGGMFGAALSVSVSYIVFDFTEPMHIVSIGLSTLAFSLFPDIDIKSTPSKIFYTLFLVYLGILYYLKKFELATLSSMLAILPQVTKHRGIFHSPIAAVLIPSYPIYFYYNGMIPLNFTLALWGSGTIGYIIHLILDKKFKFL